jgi:hypothetical protein
MLPRLRALWRNLTRRQAVGRDLVTAAGKRQPKQETAQWARISPMSCALEMP